MSTVPKKIGTHDGTFHCDEVLACFMLKKLPGFVSADIIRTRDVSILNTCDIVVDVGGVYDPKTNRFDHHQATFNSSMNSIHPTKPWKIKLSSAGLIYAHYGEEVLRTLLGNTHDKEMMTRLYDYVYENFIQEIDGIDNGVPMYDGEPKYTINSHISARVGHLNCAWNSQEEFDSQKVFYNAMDLVGKEFIDRVQRFLKIWWPARKLVIEAVSTRFNVHPTGEVMELTTYCPWISHLNQIEEERNLGDQVKFVIFPDKDVWRVRSVPIAPDSFVLRLPLHKSWQGLIGEELSKISGIDGCLFVHGNGFIGGNKTRDGALAMALKTISLQKIM